MTNQTGPSSSERQTYPVGRWTLRVDPTGPPQCSSQAAELVGRQLPATVPGSVHHDLKQAAIIPDPLVDQGEDAVAWVSRTNWVYETLLPPLSSTLARTHRVDLCFAGIDTSATITIDGEELGRTANMHRSYRFDVTRYCDGHTHRLAVRIASPYVGAQALKDAVGPRPNAYPEPFNFIRKMASSFGWDWGVTLPGAAIWQPVTLEAVATARISRVVVSADVSGGDGQLHAAVDIQRYTTAFIPPARLEMYLGGSKLAESAIDIDSVAYAHHTQVDIAASVPDVSLWHPVGYGDQPRYQLEIRLLSHDGVVLDSWEQRIGFRHTYLDRSGDEYGTGFTFVINGERVLIKGINWIPGDIAPGTMTPDRYRALLTAARDTGANMIRVWGGGIYETDEFYEICDELGLLVWQDFLFACAAYPEDDALRDEVLAEARENVARLSPHPSLVLWCGNNENLWLRGEENWQSQPGGDLPWGEKYYLEDLPAIVADIDPQRPYVAGTPWSGSWEHPPNDPAHQTHHSWQVWNTRDYTHYRDTVPRFVAEFGWQAPPAWRTLRDAVTDDPLTTRSAGLVSHQKAAGGMEKLARGLAAHFPMRLVSGSDIHTWHYLTQLTQANAIKTGISHWRSHWPVTSGTIMWQLSDVWPALSWSAIDYAGRRKPLYYALAAAYADRLVTIEPEAGAGDASAALTVCVCNDSATAWSGEMVLRRIAEAGPALARRVVRVDVPARSVTRIPLWPEVSAFDDPTNEVIVADLNDHRALWYGAEPTDTTFVGAAPSITAQPTDGGITLTVTATGLLRDCLVQADRIDPAATCDRGFFTLLPGESTTVTISCAPRVAQQIVATVAERGQLCPDRWAITWLDEVLGAAEG